MGTTLVTSMGSTCPYDIGDILQTTNSKNPSERWANTEWEQISGRFLLGIDDSHTIGSTGGNFSITQTVAQMPHHDHYVGGAEAVSPNGIYFPAWHTVKNVDNGTSGGQYYPLSVAASGGSQPMDITPPYLAVYIWQRTA